METEVLYKIEAVINTLNRIEVKGQQNLDGLLACIQTLQQIRVILTAPKEKGDEPNG